ncbi:hypothetical protein CTAYLR_007926 [Chrysophaeum taylorii]|uniref:SDR family oxidoreductase n=1 Tax=Chrysophaeum taylorii TaxID=2483200 RepID=A0AAD7UBA9_9STRA|nr:hypothetical protein CTAYLR_007926 [Chrysophaeum taylorii]
MPTTLVSPKPGALPLAIVTGANRGLGRGVALGLAREGYRVLAVCRSESEARKTSDALVSASPHGEAARVAPVVMDLAGEVGPVTTEPASVLVNNAGVYLDVWSREAFETSRRVNVLSPLALFAAATLVVGARVVNVSSGYGMLNELSPSYVRDLEAAKTIDDVTSISFRSDDPMKSEYVAPYKVTKGMLNAATRIAARDYPDLRINAVCPGWCRTSMGGPSAARSVEQGANSILWAVLEAPPDVTGGFFRDGRPLDW